MRYFTEVAPANLYSYWSVIIQDQPAEAFFEWLGSLLRQAKALRNENNYEALLIAHEFNHVHMSELFTQFRVDMVEGAKTVLRTTSLWFDQYLTKTNGIPPGARVFIAEYIERRVLTPVRAWYGDTIAQEINDLVAPLLGHPIPQEHHEVAEINRAVDFAIFDPKAGLMNDFRGKVQTLTELVHRYP